MDDESAKEMRATTSHFYYYIESWSIKGWSRVEGSDCLEDLCDIASGMCRRYACSEGELRIVDWQGKVIIE